MTLPGGRADLAVRGHVAPGFEGVRDCFAALVADGREFGAALAVHRHGQAVVDLQVGWADVDRTRPFLPDTLVHVYSVSKPITALATLYALRRTGIELDEPVRRRWPAFAAQGKEGTSVRHLIAHQAGLPAWPADLDADLHDRDALIRSLEASTPTWPPGEGHGEHALTYGRLLEGYLLEATGRDLPSWTGELATAAGLPDLRLGVAPALHGRVADLEVGEHRWAEAVAGAAGGAWHVALTRPAGALDPEVVNGAAWRSNGCGAIAVHTTARTLARLYGDLMRPSGAVASLLGPTLMTELLRPDVTGLDEMFGLEACWGLGIPMALDSGGRLRWFGMGGVGGSLAFAHVENGYSFGYTTRRLAEDSRGVLLAASVDQALA